MLGLNDDKKCEMASITKIMTFYTCLLYFEEYKLNAKIINVKVPAIAEEIEGTSAFLYKGDILSIYDLYHGLMLPSGNDAATVLSLSVGLLMLWKMKKPKLWSKLARRGGLLDFDQEKDVEKKELTILYLKHMNTNAERIGMHSTKFTSVHGLSDANNISTCKDLL